MCKLAFFVGLVQTATYLSFKFKFKTVHLLRHHHLKLIVSDFTLQQLYNLVLFHEMAGDIKVLFTFKLCVIIFAISLNNHRVKHGITCMAVAQIVVEPLWDTTASQCFVDTNFTGGIQFHGSAMETCSLQVLAPQGVNIQLQIPGRNISEEPAFIYIERDGDLEHCLHKYVLFNEQIQTCSSIYIHSKIHVVMQGSVNLYLRDVPAMESLPKCPEEGAIQDVESEGHLLRCSNVKGYNEIISCYPSNSRECRIKIPPNCGTILGHIEAIYQLCNHSLSQNHTALIIYPIQMVILDFSENTLVKIDGDAFRGLKNTSKLNLSKNNLTTLVTNAFHDLINLEFLDISSNQIAGIDVESFLHLTELRYLAIGNNMFNTLPMYTFQNLFNLETLYLDGNHITNLSAGVFVGLHNLTYLFLNNNLLRTLPTGLFQDLLSLESLHLHWNQITNLSAGIFVGLSNLRTLNLNDNLLSTLPNALFQNLLSLEILYLDGNQINTLSEGAFVGLDNLIDLSLTANMLSTLPNGIVQDLLNLKIFVLQGNRITSLNAGMFVGLGTLQFIVLDENKLLSLHAGLFQNLTNLRLLGISRNLLINLPVDIFTGLQNLRFLTMAINHLNALHAGVFRDLVSLGLLVLTDNRLANLPSGTFDGLVSLTILSLDQNRLVHLPNDIFKGLVNLEALYLEQNRLENLPYDIFQELAHLEHISIFSNQLTQFHIDTFKGLSNLHYLSLSNNSLTHLPYNTFKYTGNIVYLDLSANRLDRIPNIDHLSHLQVLDLTNNTLFMIPNTSFSSLSTNSYIFVNQHEICECYVPRQVNCSAADDRSPYLTCERLLSDSALVVVMWFISLGALSGNIFVLVWRKKETSANETNSILLQNLAASDLLMGIYMLIIASADTYFGDSFPMQSESWRSGITCRIAGAMSIISSEASVFFVTLISIDRFIAIRFPYSTRRLRKYSVRIVAVMTWTISFVLGIVPSVLSGSSFKFYDNSHVCIGLPLALTKIYKIGKSTTKIYLYFEHLIFNTIKSVFTTQYKGLANGLFFSTAVFLGLNCVCYLIILGCYVEIIRAVRQSSKLTGRSQEMKQQIKLTIKVTAIVATDFSAGFQ